MAYRKFSRSRSRVGMRRSRRSRNDLVPLSDCNDVFSFTSTPEADCTDDLTSPGTVAILYPSLMGRVAGSIPSQDRQFQKLSKGYKFRGMRFQLSVTAPLDVGANVAYSYCGNIRCAWCVMSQHPVTGVPLELASFNLFTTSELDKADILWRESFTLDWRGWNQGSASTLTSELSCDSAQRDPTFVIRTRRNIPEDKCIIFVMQMYNVSAFPLSVNTELFGYAALQNWR